MRFQIRSILKLFSMFAFSILSPVFAQDMPAVTSNGNIVTIAGDGAREFFDGSSSPVESSLNLPYGIASVSSNANSPSPYIYIADTFNHRIRRMPVIQKQADIQAPVHLLTIAGDGFLDKKGSGRFFGDGGLATAASLNFPTGVAVSSNGNLAAYVADYGNRCIRTITFSNPDAPDNATIRTIYKAPRKDTVWGVATARADGNFVFFTKPTPGDIFYFNAARPEIGPKSLLTSNGNTSIAPIAVKTPHGISVWGPVLTDPILPGVAEFDLMVADPALKRIASYHLITSNGNVSSLTGRPLDALTTFIKSPEGIFIKSIKSSTDVNSNITTKVTQFLVTDRVRSVLLDVTLTDMFKNSSPAILIDTNTAVSIRAGVGFPGFFGDGGLPERAALNQPIGITALADNRTFIADTYNNRIREFDPATQMEAVHFTDDRDGDGFNLELESFCHTDDFNALETPFLGAKIPQPIFNLRVHSMKVILGRAGIDSASLQAEFEVPQGLQIGRIMVSIGQDATEFVLPPKSNRFASVGNNKRDSFRFKGKLKAGQNIQFNTKISGRFVQEFHLHSEEKIYIKKRPQQVQVFVGLSADPNINTSPVLLYQGLATGTLAFSKSKKVEAQFSASKQPPFAAKGGGNEPP